MRRAFLLGVFVTLLTGTHVCADIPPPAGTKYVDPRVRFIGIEKYPGVAFVLSYQTGHDWRYLFPAEGIEVKNDREFTLKNTERFITAGTLLAIRKEDLGKLNYSRQDLLWLNANTPGVMAAGMRSPENLASVFSWFRPLTEYRVSLQGNTLEVQPVKKDRAEGSGRGLPFWAIGLALALSVSSFGLWITRRRGRECGCGRLG